MKYERLSEANTLIARMRNLLDEAQVPVPPDMEEEIEDKIENYKKYLEMKIESEARELREKKEHVEKTLEILVDRDGDERKEIRRVLVELKNELERECQSLETLEAESIVSDPEWV